ncbi:hypothetical protein HAX54_029656 [Datura stramonium]|uniref:Uncharacterized protein n=1 Tax=Datura stramonium TaxID=4076 RepID=A0ABS8SAC6_DATST|nr:hypothetical protein [Datura stramonium]
MHFVIALIDMLQCPPHDSLIRDHALSLAVWVQKQLNAQLGPGSGQSNRQALQLSAATSGVVNASNRTHTLANVVDDLAELQHSISATDNLSGGQIDGIATENGTNVVDDLAEFQHLSSATDNLSGGQIDGVATENGTHTDIGHAVEHPLLRCKPAHYPSLLVQPQLFS